MRISVDEIKDAGLHLEFEEPLSSFPVLAEVESQDGCCFIGPVAIRIRAFRVDGMVEVEGRVDLDVRVSCSRCLKDFSITLASDFVLTYCREIPDIEAEDGEGDVELSAEDMGLVLYDGQEIDLTQAIEEQLVLALPANPVCDGQCRGLCPQCGADRNETDCGCPTQGVNLKMAALKNFKVDKK